MVDKAFIQRFKVATDYFNEGGYLDKFLRDAMSETGADALEVLGAALNRLEFLASEAGIDGPNLFRSVAKFRETLHAEIRELESEADALQKMFDDFEKGTKH